MLSDLNRQAAMVIILTVMLTFTKFLPTFFCAGSLQKLLKMQIAFGSNYQFLADTVLILQHNSYLGRLAVEKRVNKKILTLLILGKG